MKKRKLLEDERSLSPDGRRSYNRNAAKWPLKLDEALSEALQKLREKGFTQNKALHILSMDKAFRNKIPAVGGAHRSADSPKKIYQRLAKRAQEPTVIVPGIAEALGLGQWDQDVATLRTDIEDAQKHSAKRLNSSDDSRQQFGLAARNWVVSVTAP